MLLSGIQHFRFCRRQWALIHIENQWEENYHTVDGRIVHERAHDQSLTESRGNLLVTRGVSVFSPTLGVSGQCDVVEYHRGESGIPLRGREGLWQPYPVEYKRGSPKETDADELQLCAEAMCLEEMLCCEIPRGALFYHEIRRRVTVDFTPDMRDTVSRLFEEMHGMYARSHTPMVKSTNACRACSLKELCLPKLAKAGSVREYLQAAAEEDG